MKIGILTWYFAINYGAAAHSYALQKILEQMGYDVLMINHRPVGKPVLKYDILGNINVSHKYFHPLKVLRCLYRCLRFIVNRKLYKQSIRVKNGNDIKQLGLDAIVLGSDEILNVIHPIHDKIYYGVGLESQNCIFYAPSIGKMDSNFSLTQEVINSLKRIKSFSARDPNTAILLKKYTDQDVKVVLDPTLLYDFEDIIDTNIEAGNNYVLLYAFSNLDAYKDLIQDYAKLHGLRIISVRKYYSWADKSYDVANLQEWLGLFRNASLVVTDSFHGFVFAVKNQKEFVIISTEDKVNKIKGLEETLGINRPFFTDGFIDEYITSYPIDYDEISSAITQQKALSLNFLRSALDGIGVHK